MFFIFKNAKLDAISFFPGEPEIRGAEKKLALGKGSGQVRREQAKKRKKVDKRLE